MKLYTTITGLLLAAVLCAAAVVKAADVVPDTIQQPGTQPGEVSNLESPDKCDNCHGGYHSAVEPAHNWRGSMMAHAGRDPIFWATLAIAEQDFDGAGDLCIRCHSTAGWLAGRSTPTDGSGLAAGDSDGVECDFCHKMTNPDDSEHPGLMNPDFVANELNSDDPFDWDEPNGVEGYYGSGMASMWAGSDKLGPYSDAEARHQFMQSKFHRDRDFCGSCHDVSNPAVGNLAHNHGAMTDPDRVIADDSLGDGVAGKAAFNNPPYKYGIVERTFSEYKSGRISQTLVSPFSGNETNIYDKLPAELRGGALLAAYNAATRNRTTSGHYNNPSMPRYFSCQTCHLRAVQGTGANKNGVPVRDDLPLHDMTGGNYWMPQAIEYLDGQGKLRLGGGMSAGLVTAMRDGALRAREQLELAATLAAQDDGGNVKVRIVNHTGHKLISGYPEGRRMWLRTEWFDVDGGSLGVDGEYGNLAVSMDLDGNGSNDTVRTIIDLEGSNTKIYEAHMGMTKEWASQLLGLGYSPELALSYDRITDDVTSTLSDLAGGNEASHETFHFVLNNTVVSDNRIPPYGMDYESARVRNALPVPATQYGVTQPPSSGNTATYNYFDEVTLTPPDGAASATIELLYQPTSWEYIQFLYLANNGSNSFLADEGKNMLEAWLNTGMAEPHVMAYTTWGTPPPSCEAPVPTLISVIPGDAQVGLAWSDEGTSSYSLYYDQSGKAQLVEGAGGLTTASHTDTGLTNGQEYCYKVTATSGEPACESGFSDILCAIPSQPGQTVDVPDVTGMLQLDAVNTIVAAQLNVGTVGEDNSDTVAEGYVISQSPSGGTTAQKGANVDLVVSLGPAPAPSCSAIADKGSCNNEPLCTWQGSPKNGSCVAVVACTITENPEISCTDGIDNDCDSLVDSADQDCVAVVCSVYNGNQASCQDQAACRWSRKDSLCLTR